MALLPVDEPNYEPEMNMQAASLRSPALVIEVGEMARFVRLAHVPHRAYRNQFVLLGTEYRGQGARAIIHRWLTCSRLADAGNDL